MFDFQSKFKRQIEILGLCISGSPGKPVKTGDLADFFNVEELTIKRDLQDLRSYGIDIHSGKKSGVCIQNELQKDKLVDLILHYTSLNHNDYAMDKSTSLLVEKLGIKALSNLVNLQLCIDNCLKADILYNKIGIKTERRLIEPLLIFQNEGSWRVLSQEDAKLKQYIFDKILEVSASESKFEKGEYGISDLFKYSWKTWVGSEKHKVKLHLSPFWCERIKPRILMADQKIIKNDDGSEVYECTVNSLNEIAGWIVSRGEGIMVLEPVELKQLVMELARGVLKNYEE